VKEYTLKVNTDHWFRGFITLQKIGSVVPTEVSCEISPCRIDSALSIKYLFIRVKHNSIFSREFNTHSVIGKATLINLITRSKVPVGRVEIEDPKKVLNA